MKTPTETSGSSTACEVFSGMVKKSAGLRALVVEDELLIRWSIVETLTAAGHVAVEASDGRTALDVLRDGSNRVDVVFLDFRLPDSNDLTLLAEIRRVSPGAAVIMMTAFGTPEVIKGALALGVYRVISKPFEMRDVEPLLQDAYASRS